MLDPELTLEQKAYRTRITYRFCKKSPARSSDVDTRCPSPVFSRCSSAAHTAIAADPAITRRARRISVTIGLP